MRRNSGDAFHARCNVWSRAKCRLGALWGTGQCSGVWERVHVGSASDLPAVLVTGAQFRAIMGPGESVQMTFVSPLAMTDSVALLPVFRAAMTRRAFFEFVDHAVALRDQIADNETAAKAARAN